MGGDEVERHAVGGVQGDAADEEGVAQLDEGAEVEHGHEAAQGVSGYDGQQHGEHLREQSETDGDMDFFYQNGQYYLSEINPRFGGAYLHAYGAGVDFVKLIRENVEGRENPENIGNYEEDVIMMMYDSVVIKKKSELDANLITA